MIRIALFTTLFVLSAHIAGSGITSDNGAQASEAIQEQSVSGIAVSDWVENDPCYLDAVECSWKKTMRVSEYGWTGNKNAAGKYPTVGTVACPRRYKLGTVVTIDGKEYTCEDRYAPWVQEKFGDTIDVYSEKPNGLDYKIVTIK